MIVVSDSTPLITLMKAQRLDMLQGLFGRVVVPEAVFSELTINEQYANEAALIRDSGYIEVVPVTDADRVSLLRRATGLDLGESEAIVYADDQKADVLLMDEAAGRRVAQNMGIPIAGSVGVLIRAFQSGLLTECEADEAFLRIRGANRHISERLLESALSIIHQGRPAEG